MTTGWQRIETAPKDGTPVLLFTPRRTLANGYVYEAAMVVGWFDPHHCNSETDDYGAFVAPLSDGFERAITDHFSAPTHWMPLPPPPEERG